jgi:polyisoprenoid-binding protein YceI
MLRYTALIAAVVVLALALPGRPVAPSGSFLVDAHYSAAQLNTNGTSDFGKTKMNLTIGYARVNGTVTLDNNDPAKSSFELHIYPATNMKPPIDEGGKALNEWLVNSANHTLLCFHSKDVSKTSDGRLKTTGELVLTRVDRNVEIVANEAYSGPTYGPPMVHKTSREVTFLFDSSNSGSKGTFVVGGTKVAREDFKHLMKTVLGTYWPPVVQEEHCQPLPAASEAYSGTPCTGTFLIAPTLPSPAVAANESYPGPEGFNAVTGDYLALSLSMRLTPRTAGKASGGN